MMLDALGDSPMVLVATLLLLLLSLGALVYFALQPRRRQRAGCVPLRVEPSGRISIMLVQSRKHPNLWTFPAGGIEPGEKAPEAATRETHEEAGLIGRLGRKLCYYRDKKAVTTMFALYVEAELEQWPEQHERLRRWFDVGVPGSPYAEQAVADLRARLVPKPLQLCIIASYATMSSELAQEGENCESAWKPPAVRHRRAKAGKGP